MPSKLFFYNILGMNIDWKQFITTDFWFGQAAELHKIDYLILYIGLAVLVLGLIVLIYRITTKNLFLKKIARRISNDFLIVGIAEIVWFGFRYENGAVLGTHFVAGLVALVGLVYLYWPLKYLLVRYSKDMQEEQRRQLKEKYLQAR